MNQVAVEKNGNTVCAVFSELKALGVKVPKIKKFKSGIPKQVRSVSSTRGKIFGVHLSEQEKISFANYVLPKFIFTATSYLKNYAHKEVGLFRKAGSVTRQKDLRAKLERGETIEESEPNDVASLLKQWLRELPEPLIPVNLQDLFIRSHNLQIEENRVAAVLLCCHLLPAEHLQTLKYLLEFLSDIATNSEKNKMGAHNLALLMAPNIFVMGTDSIDKSSGNSFQVCTSVMELLINNVQRISVTSTCTSLHFAESEALRNSTDLDLSIEALDYSPSKSKKKRRSGPVQDLFTGFRKLVGQNSTPLSSTKWLNPDDGKLAPASASRSASKHKADPEHLSMSPRKKQATDSRNVLQNNGSNFTPNSNCSQDVLLQEKKRGAHSRRKSFGLLRRKIKKSRQTSTKQDEPEINKVEPEANISTSSPFEVKLAVSLQVPEDKIPCLEKSSPLLSDLDIDRILKSTFTKKSVSDCYLTVRNEYQNRPAFSTSSSEGCLNDLGGENSSYNLRSGSLNKRALKRKSDVLDRVCQADKENFRQSISPRVFKKISPVSKHTSPKQETFSSIDVITAGEKSSFSENSSNLILKQCDKTDSLNTLQVLNRRGSSRRQRKINMKDSSASSFSKKEISVSNNCLGSSDAGVVNVSTPHRTSTVSVFETPCTLFAENEDKIKRQCSLKRQEAFVVRSKSSRKMNSSQIRRADSIKISKSKNHINLQRENSNASDRNLSNKKNQVAVMTNTPEKRRIRRSVRNGSIIRGRPNTVKTGLPSNLCVQFNESNSVNAVHNLLTSTSSVDNDLFTNIVNEFEKNNPDASITLQIQNITLSTPSKQISITKFDSEGNIEKSGFQATVHDVKETKSIVKKKCKERICSTSDSKIHKMKTRSAKVTRINSFPQPCTRPKIKASRSRNSSSPQKSENNKSKTVSIEGEKENICVPKTPLSTSDDVFKTPDVKFQTPETWFSGREFLESEKLRADDVSNKRESIAMILRNKQGHVQQKVHMYDHRSSSNSTPTVNRSAGVALYDPQYSNIEIRFSQSQKRNTSVTSNRSVKNKNSPLPPPPKFVLPDSPLKPSYPLKELTNINNAEDTTFSPSPAKMSLSTLNNKDNSPEKINIKCTLKPKRNSYSGHTPYKLPKEKTRVLRSESSPLLQKTVNKSSVKLLEYIAASPLSTISDQNLSFTSNKNSFNPPVFKTRSSLSIDKLRPDQLTDEWNCEM